MRLANLGGRAHIVVDDGAVDIAGLTNGRIGPDMTSAIANIDAVRHLDLATAERVVVNRDDLGPVSDEPKQIIAIGISYHDHAVEMGLELAKIPASFVKFRSALTGPHPIVTLPNENCDYETEMVVVIKEHATAVTQEHAWEVVAGLTLGQDLSDRYTQMEAGRQFSLGKSHPGFAPIGPVMVTPDEFMDRNDIRFRCSINGELRQDATTADMIYSVTDLLVALTSIIDLYPGDLIYTGCPKGAGQSFDPPRFLKAGDELECSMDLVGDLTVRFVGSPHLTSGAKKP